MIKFFSICIFILWIVGVIGVFWWQNGQYQQPFEPLLVKFDQQSLQVNTTQDYSGYLVVNFIDSGCPCSKFAKPHINDLAQQFQDRAVFITGDISLVPVTPSVAIYNDQKQLEYYGPYSAGAVCGEGFDFVSTIIISNDLNQDDRTMRSAVGCYCENQI